MNMGSVTCVSAKTPNFTFPRVGIKFQDHGKKRLMFAVLQKKVEDLKNNFIKQLAEIK